MDRELTNDWNTKVMPLKEQDGVYNFYLKKPAGQKSWAIDSLSCDTEQINKIVKQAIAERDRQWSNNQWGYSGSGFARHPRV